MGQLDNDKLTARALKAKATRIENARQEALENERLAKETEQPRGAKARALSNHVWLGKKGTQGTQGNKRAASPIEAESAAPPKQRRKGVRGMKVVVRDNEKAGSEEDMMVGTKIRSSAQHVPAAAIIPSDSESEAEKPGYTKKGKTQNTKRAASDSEPEAEKPVSRKKGKTQNTKRAASDSEDESSAPEVGKSDADNESSGSDDDQLRDGKLNEQSLMDHLNSECPVLGEDDDDEEEQVTNLFDLPDHDVEMASVKSSKYSRSSSVASQPPSTDPEDIRSFLDNNEEEEEEEEPGLLPKKTQRKSVSYKRQGQRNAAFSLEQPRIVDENEDDSDSDANPRRHLASDKKWPLHAKAVLPALGKTPNLLDQHYLIQKVLHDAIENITQECLFNNAWPEQKAKSKLAFRVDVLLQAIKGNIKAHPELRDLKQRIQHDTPFTKSLSRVFMNRLSSLRGPAKSMATSEIASYELGKSGKCETRVAVLFKFHQYIFPGTWTGETGLTWDAKKNKPYLNSAVIDTLMAAFFGNTSSIGYQYMDRYKSSVAKDNRKELPIAMVALAATAVYVALYEWRNGRKSRVKFEGNTFIAIYLHHATTLQQMKEDSPIGYHEIMADLFSRVVDTTVTDGPSGETETFAIIDLSEY